MSCRDLCAIGLAAITLAACENAPSSGAELARSEAAVRRATEENADADPHAALYLQLARSQLEHGRRLLLEGDELSAGWVLLRAEADAEAARSLARATFARADAEHAIAAIEAVAMRRLSKKVVGP